MWDISGRRVAVFATHPHQPFAFGISSDDALLATAGADGKVFVWDIAKQVKVGTVGGQLNAYMSVAFSPDGRRIAAGGVDGTLQIWNTESLKEVANRRLHNYPLDAMDFLNDDEDTLAILADGRVFSLRAPSLQVP